MFFWASGDSYVKPAKSKSYIQKSVKTYPKSVKGEPKIKTPVQWRIHGGAKGAQGPAGIAQGAKTM